MKKTLLILISGFLLAGLMQCQKDSNISPPPGKVRLVPKTPEGSPVEHGIDAVPDENGIYLEWYPNVEKNLGGYVIYRSEEIDRNFVQITKISRAATGTIDTSFVDTTVALNRRYYYFVRAFDDLDQFGEASDTVTYKLWVKPILSSPVGVISNPGTVKFVWDFDANFIPNEFVFRLEKEGAEGFKNFFTKDSLFLDDYSPHQEWDVGKLTISPPLTTGTYRWRIDPLGNEDFCGAESKWMVFVVQ